ncbi:hypothetical protein AX774_g5757 [Zancudomyces culisetae]|uniref:C2H2-type domain-containing protein n=1 Tax=Zancudomyces culisetae TaxID=1213189 RepID=A0A1R1PIQ6_ZANCU|nr:hypothetical protein AX774_g5757 [Zancudomyces culisetae]|eukprot:OMH80793.1 hypothetical protein AX774_g5757 [Zancudomyces culisetae]
MSLRVEDLDAYGCSICEVEFERRPFTFMDHVVSRHPNMKTCPYRRCQQDFPTATQMAQHVLLDHHGYL